MCLCTFLTGRYNGVMHFAFGNVLFRGSGIPCKIDTEDRKHLAIQTIGNFISFIGV